MCKIENGEIGQLLKGGMVRLTHGEVYHLKDCTFGAGGRLVLSVVSTPRIPQENPIKSSITLEYMGSKLIDPTLKTHPIPILYTQSLVAEQPKAPQEASITVETTLLATMGMMCLFVLKKVAGLDRELKAGSCQIRHQEAISRIAKLEGKVLRKQLVDGAKFVKDKLDKRSTKASSKSEDECEGED